MQTIRRKSAAAKVLLASRTVHQMRIRFLAWRLWSVAASRRRQTRALRLSAARRWHTRALFWAWLRKARAAGAADVAARMQHLNREACQPPVLTVNLSLCTCTECAFGFWAGSSKGKVCLSAAEKLFSPVAFLETPLLLHPEPIHWRQQQTPELQLRIASPCQLHLHLSCENQPKWQDATNTNAACDLLCAGVRSGGWAGWRCCGEERGCAAAHGSAAEPGARSGAVRCQFTGAGPAASLKPGELAAYSNCLEALDLAQDASTWRAMPLRHQLPCHSCKAGRQVKPYAWQRTSSACSRVHKLADVEVLPHALLLKVLGAHADAQTRGTWVSMGHRHWRRI